MGHQDKISKPASRIWTDIDLHAEGKRFGYFRLNISTQGRDMAYVPIPVASFKYGAGPRILLLGGVHGDEFEGQVMLMKLIRALDIANVKGHLIILSAANAPAAYAGRHNSPLDEGDLNRQFPGDPNGTPTQQLAYFIESVLMPKVDLVLDFHSGGDYFDVMPSAHVYSTADRALSDRMLRFLKVFGMPHSLILDGLTGKDQRAIGASERTGVPRFSSELGGKGCINIQSLRQAEQGLARLLYEVGALRAPMTDVAAAPTTFLTRLPNRKYVHTNVSGLFEPHAALGDEVTAGDPAGTIHFPEEPWREPHVVTFKDSGRIYAARSRARTDMGDLLYILAVPWGERAAE